MSDDLYNKFRPRTLQEFVGNVPAVEAVWEWFAVHAGGGVATLPRTLLLSGPQGVGKTLLIELLQQTLERVLEIVTHDASDLTGSLLASVLDNLRRPHIELFGSRRKMVVFDGVDGMNTDALHKLCAMLDEVHTPLICICNDAYSGPVRSLTTHLRVHHIKFTEVDWTAMIERVNEISVAASGRAPPFEVVQSLAFGSNGDVRRCMLDTVYGNGGSRSGGGEGGGSPPVRGALNAMVMLLDSGAQVANAERYADAMDGDPQLARLLHANYMTVVPVTIDALADAADCLSLAAAVEAAPTFAVTDAHWLRAAAATAVAPTAEYTAPNHMRAFATYINFADASRKYRARQADIERKRKSALESVVAHRFWTPTATACELIPFFESVSNATAHPLCRSSALAVAAAYRAYGLDYAHDAAARAAAVTRIKKKNTLRAASAGFVHPDGEKREYQPNENEVAAELMNASAEAARLLDQYAPKARDAEPRKEEENSDDEEEDKPSTRWQKRSGEKRKWIPSDEWKRDEGSRKAVKLYDPYDVADDDKIVKEKMPPPQKIAAPAVPVCRHVPGTKTKLITSFFKAKDKK